MKTVVHAVLKNRYAMRTCVRIWKFNDHVGKKAAHASQTKEICVLSP